MNTVTHQGIELQPMTYLYRPYSLACCTITMQTENGIKIVPPGLPKRSGIWMPKSQCAWTKGDATPVLYCEEPIARANGLHKWVEARKAVLDEG